MRWSKLKPRGIGAKIVAFNCLFLAIVVACQVFYVVETSRVASMIDQQAAASRASDEALTARLRFTEMSYWLTEHSLSMHDTSRAEVDRLYALMEDRIAGSEDAAKRGGWLDAYRGLMDTAVDAYVDEDRVSGNVLALQARSEGSQLQGALRADATAATREAGALATEAVGAASRLKWVSFVVLLVTVPLVILLSVVLIRQIGRPVGTVAGRLTLTAHELLTASQQQQTGSGEQAAAAEETKRTMEGLLDSARSVASLGQQVLKNAELSRKNSHTMAVRIEELSRSADRIGEILEMIKGVANKSDLLALNAALEGTKAGEVGRGFSLVATQMQRLAEQVMGSVKDITLLTAEISEATNSSVLVSEEASKLADATAHSAQQISSAISEQQTATQEVTVAMDDVASAAQQNVEAARLVVMSAQRLSQLSGELSSLVGRDEMAA